MQWQWKKWSKPVKVLYAISLTLIVVSLVSMIITWSSGGSVLQLSIAPICLLLAAFFFVLWWFLNRKETRNK